VAALVNRVVELDLGKVVLDERLAHEESLAGLCAGRVVCREPEPALAKALAQWNFRPVDEAQCEWLGQVAGPDRLRFLGTVSRYVSVVRHVSLQEDPSQAQSAAEVQP
jgi:ABC-2 type transport system ATP-binding protein